MTLVRMDTWTFRHFERPAVLGLQPFWVSDISPKDGSYMFRIVRIGIYIYKCIHIIHTWESPVGKCFGETDIS